MNAEKIKNIISRELDGRKEVPNWHGVSLEKCLLEPSLIEIEDSFNDNEVIKLWLVLEEDPIEKSAYKIVYDPEEDIFGLAVSGNTLPVLIGFYGTFVETLEGM